MTLDGWHDYMNELERRKARKSQDMSQNVNSLFKAATHDGNISMQSLHALNNVDPGAQIQQALGVDIGDVQASEVILVTLLVDDSGSIRFVAGNTEAVRDGCNGVLAALGDSKQTDGILVMCRYLNGTVLYPYCALKDAKKMDAQNYNPGGGTPLYEQTVVTCGAVVAKAQEFEDNGVSVRTVTAIITDGADENPGGKATASHCKSIISDMLHAEKHIVCAMGIDDGGRTDFHKVFNEMGIQDQWILTPGNSPKEIRKAFQVISQSAVRASQASGASFSKTALGGFGG